ncbi:MAG: hypothetical protein ACE5H8_13465 [Alphaproteobacteria bacterium]
MRIDWRSRSLWMRTGYALTAAWMLGVIVATGSDVTHPFFDFIFIVPLSGWIFGLLIARLAMRLWPPPDRAEPPE